MARHLSRWLLPAVAVVSLQLAGCGGESDEPSRSRATPSEPATTSANDAEPTWTLLSDESEPLEAGAYGLTANGVSDTVAVVQAPAGYENFRGWTLAQGEPFRAIGYMTAERVYRDPCGLARDDKKGTLLDPGPTVANLAEALVAQRGTKTSKPVPVAVDGYKGLYLDYEVSKGIDPGECQYQAFDIFSTGPGSWYLQVSRERAGIWILDVDGERLVLAWVAAPGVTKTKITELVAMVESTHFVSS